MTVSISECPTTRPVLSNNNMNTFASERVHSVGGHMSATGVHRSSDRAFVGGLPDPAPLALADHAHNRAFLPQVTLHAVLRILTEIVMA